MTDEFSLLILLAGLLLLLSYLIAFRFDVYNDALISPLRVWAGLGILTSVPYVALLGFNVLRPDALLEKSLWAVDLDEVVLKYAVWQALGTIALVAGYRSSAAVSVAKYGRRIPTRIATEIELPLAWSCLLLGAFLWGWMLIQAGGVWLLLTNIEYRSQILSGAGYLMQFGSGLLTIGALLGLYSVRSNRRPANIALWLVVLVCVALALSLTGGRKGTIYLAIGGLLVWHYCVRPIRGLSIGLILLGLVLAAYFVVILAIRTLGGIEIVLYNPYLLWLAIFDSLVWTFANLSYVDTYVYVVATFDQTSYWFGATFGDLFVSWIPSSLMPGKPPVDDGVYLRSLAEGMRVEPGIAAASLYPSSWPPETFGMGYMSFGPVGVIALFALLGAVIRTAIEFAREQDFSFISVFLFSHILLNFELSNLRLVQLFTTLVTLGAIISMVTLLQSKRPKAAVRAIG